MKNLRFSEFKAFWENDHGVKFAAWLWTPEPRGTNIPVWCLCYDGFSQGKKECPIIKDYFPTLSEAIEYAEGIRGGGTK